MRMYDIIDKKKKGGVLAKEEIRFFIEGITQGLIPDYQISALLMAVYFQGMTEKETVELTLAMADSGDRMDLSRIPGIKVDKHSTGGVGDKTTLVVAPIAAACGLKVAKMSGRGLGHTGGTIDKLAAIPGCSTSLSEDQFLGQVNRVGAVIAGQTGNLAPADKILYALRDVTATVDSIPLIASSIMSKKLAAGADCILLDVKTGSGALTTTLAESKELAGEMVRIGIGAGKRTAALITDMDTPLGHAVGNASEVAEAVRTLWGEGPGDLTQICVELSAGLLALAGRGELSQCRNLVEAAIRDGSAFSKLREMVAAQGGDISVLEDPGKLPAAPFRKDIVASEAGYYSSIDAQKCGLAAMTLGAGRKTKDDEIDLSAGLELQKKPGEAIRAGDILATLYTSDKQTLAPAGEIMGEAIRISDARLPKKPLIIDRIGFEK